MHPNIQIIIEADYEAMSRKGAQLFAEAMRAKPNSVFGLPTGSTPEGLYKELVRMHKDEGLDFSAVTTFNLDEYYPIERESEQSYYHYMQKHLFGHVNAGESRINIPNGKAEDASKEAAAYEEAIESAGGIDLQILGIGMNGHIGFNEPADSFGADTRHVPLTEITIASNARFFASADEVPRHAVTMGMRSIMTAKRIILMASGEGKAGILRDSFLGPVTPLVPASVLQLHPNVIVLADKDAAGLL